MIEIEHTLIDAILKFKREYDPYLAVIHKQDEIHSIITGDRVSFLWLVSEPEPLTDDMEISPLTIVDIPIVQSVTSVVNKRAPIIPIRLGLTPTNDLTFSAPGFSGDFTMRADPAADCPSLAELVGLLREASKASREKHAEFHPARIHKVYQATKKICGKNGMPRVIPNGGDPGLVLLDDEPRLFGILMPMVERPYPGSVIAKILRIKQSTTEEK
jgi:hypothetical protein